MQWTPAVHCRCLMVHELRHLWQGREYGDWVRWWLEQTSEADLAGQERDADDWAAQYLTALGW